MMRWVVLALCVAGCRADPIPPARRFPAGTGFTPRQIEIDGTSIRYVDAGRGPPVVFLHGLGASMYGWRGALRPVADAGFRVIAFDNRGFGFSGKPRRGYSNDDYVLLLRGLLDSLGVGEAVLVGHSMGGQIAAEFALAHPERVRALALVAAAGFGIRVPVLLRAARWPIVGSLASGLRWRWVTGRVLRSTYANPSRVTTEDVDQYYAPVAEPDYAGVVQGVLRGYRFDALPGRLSALRVPALVLWGDQDRWIPPVIGRRLAAEIERVAFIVIPAAGHALQEEAPDRFNQILLEYLRHGLPRIPEDMALSTPEHRLVN